jgi:hypothetical protein
MSSPRPRSQKEFDSLDAMMRAYAEDAVRLAAEDHGMALDYSPESIPRLETVLSARGPIPEPEQEEATRLWGAYYGEIFRHKFPAEWIMAVYPTPQYAGRQDAGSDVAMPALDIAGSHVYDLPHRRPRRLLRQSRRRHRSAKKKHGTGKGIVS